MYLEGVILCLEYDDFLSETLPTNKHLFDKLIIVTATWSEATKEVCKREGVEYVVREEPFYMTVGINRGLEELSKKDWVLFTNADMFYAPNFRQNLENSNLDPTKIYGIDRYRVKGFSTWNKFKTEKIPHNEVDRFGLRSRANAFKSDPRIYSDGPPSRGYVPCGYFQLWNPKGSGVYSYLDRRDPLQDDDIIFSKQWSVDKREVLTDVFGYHLESEDHYVSIDWNGRKSKRFEKGLNEYL